MRVAIVGAGAVGRSIAAELLGNGHTVMLIEKDGRKVRTRAVPGAEWVQADACEVSSLEEAQLATCDVVVAATGDDKANLVVSLLAKTEFAVNRVVARIYDSKRAEVYERMGIPSVATVPWTVNRLLRELLSVKVSEMWREPTGQVLLMRVTVTETWVGRKLSELEAASGARASWLVRFGEAQLPTPGTVLQDGDHLVVAVTDAIAGRVHEVVEQGTEGGEAR